MKLKIHYISYTLLIVLLTSCYKKECNCTDFRTGTFEFVQEINGEKQSSTFTRTENLQIETFKGKTDTATVRWVNDCEFVLQKLHPKNREEKKAIAIKILHTDDQSYTFEYSYVGEAKQQQGTVKKIK